MRAAGRLTPVTSLDLAAVAAGGAAGAVTRWGIGESLGHPDGFPWPTFTVNVLGAALLALLPAVAVVRRRQALTVALGPGFLGGFTTLSAVSEEVRSLVADDRAAVAGTYVLASLAASLVAVHLMAHLASRGELEDFTAEGGLE